MEAPTSTSTPAQAVSKQTTPAKKAPTPVANGANLKCGKYEGPMAGGKPNGVGGIITVTRSYSIDLKGNLVLTHREVIEHPGLSKAIRLQIMLPSTSVIITFSSIIYNIRF